MANYVREVHHQDTMRGGTRIHRTAVEDRSPDQWVDRTRMVIFYIASVVSGLLLIRFILSLFGANRGNMFADFMYGITNPLVAPFQGLFGYDTTYGVSRFEIETIMAIIVYAILAATIAGIVNLMRKNVDDIELEA